MHFITERGNSHCKVHSGVIPFYLHDIQSMFCMKILQFIKELLLDMLTLWMSVNYWTPVARWQAGHAFSLQNETQCFNQIDGYSRKFQISAKLSKDYWLKKIHCLWKCFSSSMLYLKNGENLFDKYPLTLWDILTLVIGVLWFGDWSTVIWWLD